MGGMAGLSGVCARIPGGSETQCFLPFLTAFPEIVRLDSISSNTTKCPAHQCDRLEDVGMWDDSRYCWVVFSKPWVPPIGEPQHQMTYF